LIRFLVVGILTTPTRSVTPVAHRRQPASVRRNAQGRRREVGVGPARLREAPGNLGVALPTTTYAQTAPLRPRWFACGDHHTHFPDPDRRPVQPCDHALFLLLRSWPSLPRAATSINGDYGPRPLTFGQGSRKTLAPHPPHPHPRSWATSWIGSRRRARDCKNRSLDCQTGVQFRHCCLRAISPRRPTLVHG